MAAPKGNKNAPGNDNGGRVSGKHRAGRPSGYTMEIGDVLCERLANGESLRRILSDDGMPSMSMVFRWLAADELFREQYTHARAAQADHDFDGLCDMADEPPEKKADGSVDIGWVQHQRLRIETRKWAISKLAPKKYGEKVSTELTGANGGPIQTQDLSPNDICRRIAFALQLGMQKPRNGC